MSIRKYLLPANRGLESVTWTGEDVLIISACLDNYAVILQTPVSGPAKANTQNSTTGSVRDRQKMAVRLISISHTGANLAMSPLHPHICYVVDVGSNEEFLRK